MICCSIAVLLAAVGGVTALAEVITLDIVAMERNYCAMRNE